MTRQSDARQLTHVITQLCERPDDGPLRQALTRDNYISVDNILYTPQEDLKLLEYANEDGELQEVPKGDIAILSILRDFAAHRRHNGNPIDDWTEVTQEDFREFRISTLGSTTSGGRALQENERPADDAAAHAIKDFEKSIKRDPDAFPLLQDGKNWNKWWTDFVYEVQSQGLDNLLNKNYTPTTASEITLFEKQSRYMVSVCNKKLRSDKAKEIIREHKGKRFQAQLILRDVQEYGQKSTSAKAASRKILKSLMDARVNSPTPRWKGGTLGFVRSWKEQCDQYEELKGQPLDEDSKLTMLQTAVRPFPDLRSIATQSTISGALDKDKEVTFAQYYELLQTAAEQYDEEHGKSIAKSRRQVFHTEFDGQTEDEYECDPDYEYEANRTGTTRTPRPSKGFMPSNAWRALTPEQQELWQSFPSDIRETILAARSSRQETSVNMHAVSAEDYLRSLQVNLTDMSGHELITAMNHDQERNTKVSWADDDAAATFDDDNPSDSTGSERVAAKATMTPRHSPTSVINVLSHDTKKKAKQGTKPKPDILGESGSTCDVELNGKRLTLKLLGPPTATK